MKITKAYTRRYRDNGELKSYVEWSDGSRTEGDAKMYHGIPLPCGVHMGALFDRALRDGLTIGRETW
jgi:hypothetical protein